MIFSSLLFLFRFLPAVLLLYYAVPKKFRNAILFFASLVFYAWGEPVYVLIMLFSTAVDYLHGRAVDACRNRGEMKKAKCFVLSSVVINLGILIFFKYSGFLVGNVNAILGTSFVVPNLALPIGISFYTFQTMSYTIDIYRGAAKVQKNIISFGAYVALFPQLIAGPIVQYNTIAEQLDHRTENVDAFSYGITRFLTGLGKKVLLANNIGLLWNTISASSPESLTVAAAWMGAIAYTIQIYFDFSGYSDMAIGLGSMFGFRFLENFRYPYEARTITEFWRRWHISLSSWFRDYVYIPLGGNRQGIAKQLRNILIVWLLTGLWHGASWNFVCWGLYFGALLILEKLFLLKLLKKTPVFFGHVYTMFFVIISWVIFAFDDFSLVKRYLVAMFGGSHVGLVDRNTLYLLVSNALLLVVLVLACTHYPKKLGEWLMERLKKTPLPAVLINVFLAAIFLVSVAYLVDASYNPFLYFRF